MYDIDKMKEVPGMARVVAEVMEERARQESKWGPQNHPPEWWLTILGEEVGEANKALLESRFHCVPGKLAHRLKLGEFREELIQIAAVAVAMVESLDRNELKAT